MTAILKKIPDIPRPWCSSACLDGTCTLSDFFTVHDFFLVSLPEFDLPVVAAVVGGVVPLPAKTFSSLRKSYLLSARNRFQYGSSFSRICDLQIMLTSVI